MRHTSHRYTNSTNKGPIDRSHPTGWGSRGIDTPTYRQCKSRRARGLLSVDGSAWKICSKPLSDTWQQNWLQSSEVGIQRVILYETQDDDQAQSLECVLVSWMESVRTAWVVAHWGVEKRWWYRQSRSTFPLCHKWRVRMRKVCYSEGKRWFPFIWQWILKDWKFSIVDLSILYKDFFQNFQGINYRYLVVIFHKVMTEDGKRS